MKTMRRFLAILLLLAAVGTPLPACAPEHQCCTGPERIQAASPDCCGPAICAAPEENAPATVEATLAALPPAQTPAEEPVFARRSDPVPATWPPPETGTRLARLSTLLI